ncbi:MAG: type II toxin-antitoxin system VapC family toxin [Armatimonadetes bacterium]|nr:type II toxin-antitoxin system VapC family toxin [Armatimonadota bacterium]
MNFVYDSNVLIAYLEDEPGATAVEALLSDRSNVGFVHVINLCEVFYHTRRKLGEEAAQEACTTIRQLGLNIREDLDEDFWQQAARIKAEYARVSLADCFCVSLANRTGAEMVTSDRHEIGALAKAGVCKVRFIR